jgi:hypothetical protein
MKIQILRLDSHDDLASIRDRLAWIQAGRVILVWPKDGPQLHRRLDLVLLQRQAERRGAQLGLVTRDPAVQDHARALGIPLLASEDSLDQEAWRRGRRPRMAFKPPEARLVPQPPPRPIRPSAATLSSRIGRALAAAAILVTPLLLAAALIPSAEIRLRPRTEPAAAQVVLTLDPAHQSPPQDGTIPAREVKITLQADGRVPTSGSSPQPGPAAAGEVVFTNLTEEGVRIPAGSGLRAGGAGGPRFLVTGETTVYPGRGQQVVAAIQALEGGPQGNVPAGAIDTVDGPLGLLVSVTNLQPTAGGALVDRPSVAAADQARLEAEVRADVLEQASRSLQEQLSPGERLAESSLRIVAVLQTEYDHAVGDPADTLGLVLTADLAALAFSMDDAQAAARQALAGSLPPGRTIVDPGTVIDIVPGGPASAADQLTLRIDARASQSIDPNRVARQALALPADLAARRLAAAFDLSEPPRITPSPAWLPRMPFLQHRIHVVLDSGAEP